jgi:hypothetical protein
MSLFVDDLEAESTEPRLVAEIFYDLFGSRGGVYIAFISDVSPVESAA